MREMILYRVICCNQRQRPHLVGERFSWAQTVQPATLRINVARCQQCSTRRNVARFTRWMKFSTGQKVRNPSQDVLRIVLTTFSALHVCVVPDEHVQDAHGTV